MTEESQEPESQQEEKPKRTRKKKEPEIPVEPEVGGSTIIWLRKSGNEIATSATKDNIQYALKCGWEFKEQD